MIVRIRLGKGPRVRRARGVNRGALLALGALLTPAAWMAGVLAVWRLASDLQFAGEFGIASGVFSHWQVWLSTAAALGWGALALNRAASRDDDGSALS